ncbi:MAG: hypothetical protein U1E76_06430 [Planctomycetota bacterium]
MIVDQYLPASRRTELAPRLNNLAWSFVAPHSPDHDASGIGLRLAREACSLTQHQNAATLSTLAEAEFLNGHFTEAVAAGEEAVRLWPADRTDVPLAAIVADLARYRRAVKK